MTPAFRIALLSSSSLTPLTTGEVLYTTAGSYTFTAQFTGAHWVECQGPGGSGASSGSDAGGGGGGANAWARFDMVQGQTATVVVGVPGAAKTGTGAGNDATDSSFTIDGSHYLIAEGGDGGKLSNLQTGQASLSVLGFVTSSGGGFGGRGGRGYAGGFGGGGGAGGPQGAGGDGGDVVISNATNGGGGGGGGGGQGTGAGQGGSGGGGVSFLSEGSSGSGGAAGAGGTGGSGGANGVAASLTLGGAGGDYGGGGGGGDGLGAAGGKGFVRIIWGSGRSWPSNASEVVVRGVLNFPADKYQVKGVRCSTWANIVPASFSRTGAKFVRDMAGTLTSVSTGVLARSDKGALIEEARTNICLYSQTLENTSGWTTLNSSVTANAIVAPDGTTTADAIVETGTTAVHRIQSTGCSVVSGTTYTLSGRVKRNAVDYLHVDLTPGLFGTNTAIFNINSGSVVSSTGGTAGVIAIGDFYFWWMTRTATSTGSSQIFLAPSSSSSSASYAGVNARVSAYLWGIQLEAGPAATSYNATTTATVTRGADVPSLSHGLPASDFDITADWSNDRTPGATARVFEFHDGSDANRLWIQQNSSGVVSAWVTNASTDTQIGSNSSALTGAQDISVTVKRRSGNWEFWVNGVQVGSATAASKPTVTTLLPGYKRGGTEYLNAYLRTLRIAPV